VTFLPGPIGSEKRSMGNVATDVIQPFVVRERAMAGIVAYDEQSKANKTIGPIPIKSFSVNGKNGHKFHYPRTNFNSANNKKVQRVNG